MSGVARWRLALSLAALALLSAGIFFSPTVGGLAIVGALALGAFALGERLWRRLACRPARRADAADRARDPPA